VLAGKVALVTGGGSGIGRVIAARFIAEGASVIISGSGDRIVRAAGELGAIAIRADVSREPDVSALFGRCRDAFDRLDILVNNAGIPGPIKGAAEVDIAEFDRTIAVNVRGLLLCIKYAIPLMRAAGGGSIINMSSLMGLRGYPMRSAYAASKFAVIGITESVAHEVGVHGIRVNALCPGAVSGELMDRVVARRAEAEQRAPEEILKTAYLDVSALRRWVTPDQVASTALFLASDASGAITGERIKVDAGRL
jgi:NAD(P)-dependent dehydrogenase (short-subunit alcohol dehydrogenase family)